MKTKVKDVIKSYLTEKLKNTEEFIMANHIIETELPKYGNAWHAVLHSPGTYSRAWRLIREGSDGLEQPITFWAGFVITEVEEKSAEKYFKIIKQKEASSKVVGEVFMYPNGETNV